MQHRTRRVARRTTAVAAAALLAGGAVVGTQVAAASAATHTLRFTTSQLADVIHGGKDIATDQDKQHGTVTGYDVTTCAIDFTTHEGHCRVALARAGGVLLGTATVNVDTGKGTGKVTGGSGSFKGVHGTITVRSVDQSSNRIVIRYHH
jgi:hypothetical protein